jgi:capsid protein
VRERGYDPEALASEIAADRARFEQLNIVIDSDPVVTTQVGQIQKSTGTGLSGSAGSSVVG